MEQAQVKVPFRQAWAGLRRGSPNFWILNLANFGDGMAYFGILALLNPFLTQSLHMSDSLAGLSLAAFTALVALFQLNGGRIADAMSVPAALTASLACEVVGRGLLSLSPHLPWEGLGNQRVAWLALALMAYGAGVAQTALYLGVKRYTRAESESLGWDLLYSIMNLGIVAISLVSPFLRNPHLSWGSWQVPGLDLGIGGVFGCLTALTGLLLLANLVLFREPEGSGGWGPFGRGLALTLGVGLLLGVILHDTEVHPWLWARLGLPLVLLLLLGLLSYLRHLSRRFAFFIFILFPVRTLFAHQWLTMSAYILRCYPPQVHQVLEWIEGINPVVVALAVPGLALLTRRLSVVDVMILGSLVSAAITFILVPAPDSGRLIAYMVIFSLGEALWVTRFLEYVAKLAPPQQLGLYLGVANLPWLLAKFTTGLYSGWMLHRFVPEQGPQSPGSLWMIYGAIALISPLGLLLARSWLRR